MSPLPKDSIRPQTDQRTIIATGEAMKQGFRIEQCQRCGGPEVFSKINPLSRCLRCGTKREHLSPRQHKLSWRRCACCNEQRMAGVPMNKKYCLDCQALSSHERAKQTRWRLERESRAETVLSAPKIPNENGGESGEEGSGE